MSRYRGKAVLTERGGQVIRPEVEVLLSDDIESAPSEARAAPFYGEIWMAGDLMIDPLRNEPRCSLQLGDGSVVSVRVNSWTDGGSRAQVVGEGPPPRWPDDADAGS
jgi:hypothetical protein